MDDQDFPYIKLFHRDGYTIEKWDDVNNLADIESGKYDLVLLDLLGVGTQESADQGLGILKHLRNASPAQLVVAYSNADWPVRYQPFFDMADAVLAKTADYVSFKRTVDELLDERFSLGFYLGRIERELKESGADMTKTAKKASDAILSGQLGGLRDYLSDKVDAITLDRVLNIAQVAIGIWALWNS